MRAFVAGALCVAAVGGGAGYAALAGGDASGAAAEPVAAISEWRWAPRDELPSRPRTERRERAARRASPADGLEPVVGSTAGPEEDDAPDGRGSGTGRTASRSAGSDDAVDGAAAVDALADAKPPSLPKPNDDAALVKAEVLKNGVALPPLQAPPEVRKIFEAGNTIARHPYKWGGGHGKWQDNGYDCSGSVSYALAAAGLLDSPQASGPLMGWGRPGKGKWITIYSNPGHVFMVVAGVRFDTVARGQTGSRWINSMAGTSGYVARHWPGL